MEIPLTLILIDNSRLFYQVTDDMPAYGNALQKRTKKSSQDNNQGHSLTGVSWWTEIVSLNQPDLSVF